MKLTEKQKRDLMWGGGFVALIILILLLWPRRGASANTQPINVGGLVVTPENIFYNFPDMRFDGPKLTINQNIPAVSSKDCDCGPKCGCAPGPGSFDPYKLAQEFVAKNNEYVVGWIRRVLELTKWSIAQIGKVPDLNHRDFSLWYYGEGPNPFEGWLPGVGEYSGPYEPPTYN